MSEQKLVTLLQLRQFLDGTQEVEFRGCGKDQDRYTNLRYAFTVRSGIEAVRDVLLAPGTA